jgi:hypothetical protein
MFRRFSAGLSGFLIITIGVSAISCGGSSSAARYRVVQAIPDAPTNLDISINGKNAFTNVGFGAVLPQSGYNTVSAGNVAIAVSQTGASTPVIESTPLNLGGKSHSTVLLTGDFAAPAVTIVGDDVDPPGSGMAELRVIDASPSAPQALDIYIVTPGTDIKQVAPSIPTLSFKQASLYIPLTTKNGVTDAMVVVTPAGDNSQQLISHLYTLGEGQIHTLVLVDVSPAGGALSFVPLVLSDN